MERRTLLAAWLALAMLATSPGVSLAGNWETWRDAFGDELPQLPAEEHSEGGLGGLLGNTRHYADPAGGSEDAAAEEGELSPECIALRQDAYADVGKVLRAGCQPTTAQMSRLMDNPLGNVAMWINQLDILPLTNDQVNRSAEIQTNYMGIFQFPKGITENWNLINRIVYNIPSAPLDQDRIDAISGIQRPPSIPPPGGGPISPPPGILPIDIIGGRTSGFGDMIYLGLASPKEGISHGPGQTSVWGFGLGQTFPSASEDVLGSGKWSMGPAALYAYLGQKWKLGGLLQTYFSYAGSSKRTDVRTMNLQLFYYYSITETISIGAGPNIIADFEADSGDQWTVPIGIGVGKTVQLGKVPFRFMLEYYGSVVRPDTIGTSHDVRIVIIPAVPAGLIPFL
jgi:hypothetical protein